MMLWCIGMITIIKIIYAKMLDRGERTNGYIVCNFLYGKPTLEHPNSNIAMHTHTFLDRLGYVINCFEYFESECEYLMKKFINSLLPHKLHT